MESFHMQEKRSGKAVEKFLKFAENFSKALDYWKKMWYNIFVRIG